MYRSVGLDWDLTTIFSTFSINRRKQSHLVGIHHRHLHLHANHLTKVLETAINISRMTIDMIDVAEARQETAINMNERLVLVLKM